MHSPNMIQRRRIRQKRFNLLNSHNTNHSESDQLLALLQTSFFHQDKLRPCLCYAVFFPPCYDSQDSDSNPLRSAFSYFQRAGNRTTMCFLMPYFELTACKQSSRFRSRIYKDRKVLFLCIRLGACIFSCKHYG